MPKPPSQNQRASSTHVTESGPFLTTGRDAWQRGDYVHAVDRFRRAEQQTEPGALVALVKACASLGDTDEAVRLATQSSDGAARFLALLYQLGQRPYDKILRELVALEHEPAIEPLRRAALMRLAAVLQGRSPETLGPDFDWLLAHGLKPNHVLGTAPELLRYALAQAPAEGLILEFGVFFGRSIRILAEQASRQIHGFDSFEGLPEAWSDREPAGSYSTGGAHPAVPKNVALHQGWFEQSLPPFLEAHDMPISFVHIDCDLYSSTCTILDALAPRLMSGSILVFDDFVGYPGWEQHEFRAFAEACERNSWRWELIGHALLGREVAVRLVAP